MNSKFYTPEQIITRVNLKKCDECRGDIKYVCDGLYKCEKCGKEFLDDYGKVKEYLYKNGKSSISEISRATGVSMISVHNMLKYCKMEILQPSVTYLRCEMCGTSLTHGQICKECSQKLLKKEKLDDLEQLRLINVGEKPKKGVLQEPDFKRMLFKSQVREIKIPKKETVEELGIKSQETNSKLVKDLYEKKKSE